MIEQPHTLFYKLRFVLVGLLVVANVLLVLFLLASVDTNHAEAKEQTPSTNKLAMEMSGSPNVVSDSMAIAIQGIGRAMDSAEHTVASTVRSAASASSQSSKAITKGIKTGIQSAARGVGGGIGATGKAAGKGVGFVGNAIGDGTVFVLRIPGNILESVSNSSVVRPSDHVEVPIIDPNSPELKAALAALPATEAPNPAAPQKNAGPAWPIHGAITTHFGVSHWPFQHTHTGIDISDGQAPGVTPIRPFRPGRVVNVIHSSYGLGNHVIIDHGSGVTSVYAHLNSTSVKVNQEVTKDTVLGFEGSTGASTGTHLHFEVRVNGQATDPRQFISGQP